MHQSKLIWIRNAQASAQTDMDPECTCISTNGYGSGMHMHRYKRVWIRDTHKNSAFMVTARVLYSDHFLRNIVILITFLFRHNCNNFWPTSSKLVESRELWHAILGYDTWYVFCVQDSGTSKYGRNHEITSTENTGRCPLIS